jgi:tetratricopeptide (TPR) repeat protein
MAAAVVPTANAADARALTAEQELDGLFDMEKQIVFGVLRELGVELTPAEIEAINENRAANLLAFLAYGRGLEASDRGDYEEALQQFDQAAELDPGFAPVQERRSEAGALATATETTPPQIAERATEELPALAEAPGDDVLGGPQTLGGPDPLLDDVNTIDNPATQLTGQTTATATSTAAQQATNRNPSAEGTGQEGVNNAATATIRITIPAPPATGGGQ